MPQVRRFIHTVVPGPMLTFPLQQFLNTDALNWGAKTGWFWAGMCGLCFVYAFFRLPEPKVSFSLPLRYPRPSPSSLPSPPPTPFLIAEPR